MPQSQIRFEDGAAYERMMGAWSRLVGAAFLDWLAPPAGLRWIDVGCGAGAFTELLVERCAPAAIEAIDPSEAQLAFARQRAGAGPATFRLGDAMALPFPDAGFDAAVMALVLFFVPDPAKALREMIRVTRPGGLIAAYVWDIFGGGLPVEPFNIEMRELGVEPLLPPSAGVSGIAALEALWAGAGFMEITTRAITVERVFADFDELWAVTSAGSAVGQNLGNMSAADVDRLKARMREKLPAGADGRITNAARANAVKGRVPG